MRGTRCCAALCMLIVLGCALPARAQDTGSVHTAKKAHMRPAAGAAQKKQTIPSIIQSELERSRSEEKQQHPATAVAPASQSRTTTESGPASTGASSPLWPVFVSVFVAACITGAIVYFLFLRRQTFAVSPAPRTVASLRQSASPAPATNDPAQQRESYDRGVSDDAGRASVFQNATDVRGVVDAQDDSVSSAAPYVIDDDSEMPEAALTMNLINKKRELKKELIQEVMRRVARKEKPQQIAEALRVGIGEVQLAMTLAKLKK